MAGEKTEKATPKRKQDERKKGNVLQSKEVVTIFSLLVTFFTLKTLAPLIVEQLSLSFHKFWTMATTVETMTLSYLKKIFVDGAIIYAISTMPLLMAAGLTSI